MVLVLGACTGPRVATTSGLPEAKKGFVEEADGAPIDLEVEFGFYDPRAEDFHSLRALLAAGEMVPPSAELLRHLKGVHPDRAAALIGNQTLDFGKQDGVTEIEEALEASEVVADVALLDGDAAVRVEGVKQLGALGAVEPIAERALRDPDVRVRSAAVAFAARARSSAGARPPVSALWAARSWARRRRRSSRLLAACCAPPTWRLTRVSNAASLASTSATRARSAVASSRAAASRAAAASASFAAAASFAATSSPRFLAAARSAAAVVRIAGEVCLSSGRRVRAPPWRQSAAVQRRQSSDQLAQGSLGIKLTASSVQDIQALPARPEPRARARSAQSQQALVERGF